MEQRISLITLGVADLARATHFYQALGWNVTKQSETIRFFQIGGMVFSLYPRALLAEDAQTSPEGSGFSSITLAYNTRNLTHPKREAQEVFWGGYSGYFADPDGNL